MATWIVRDLGRKGVDHRLCSYENVEEDDRPRDISRRNMFPVLRVSDVSEQPHMRGGD